MIGMKDKNKEDAGRPMFKLAENLINIPAGVSSENSWVYSSARECLYGLIVTNLEVEHDRDAGN